MPLPIEAPLDRRELRRNGSDRREAPRCRCPIPVLVEGKDQEYFKQISDVIDLSHSGARIRVRRYIKKLTEIQLTFYIMENGGATFHNCLPIQGTVISSFQPNSEGFMQLGICFSEDHDERHGIKRLLREYL